MRIPCAYYVGIAGNYVKFFNSSIINVFEVFFLFPGINLMGSAHSLCLCPLFYVPDIYLHVL